MDVQVTCPRCHERQPLADPAGALFGSRAASGPVSAATGSPRASSPAAPAAPVPQSVGSGTMSG